MVPRRHRAPARHGWLLLAASIAIFPVGGCGGQSGSDRSTTSPEATATTTSAPAGNTPSPANESPSRSGGVARTTTIASPKPGPVAVREAVEGTAAAVPPDRNLWLVVWPKSQNRYHPQPGPIEVSGDGTWKTPCYFGEPDTPKGTRYTLMLVEADPSASAAFTHYLNDADAVRTYRGMATMPAGVRILVTLAYVRR